MTECCDGSQAINSVAYASPFVPAAWIAAHGLEPLRLVPKLGAGPAQRAGTRGLCAYAGATLDAALDSRSLAALVLATGCDQIRYVAAILELRASLPLFLLNLPSTWQTETSRRIYAAELRRLGEFLVRLGGRAPSPAALAEWMIEDEERRAARREAADRDVPRGGPPRVPIALVGGPMLPADEAIVQAIERAGGRIVLDGTEFGERTQPRSFDRRRLLENPFEELADAYFSIPDPSRRPNAAFYEWLECRLRALGVRGILLRRYVWCDLWHAELQRLREATGLPVLDLDTTDDDRSALARHGGRVEAFLEMLR